MFKKFLFASLLIFILTACGTTTTVTNNPQPAATAAATATFAPHTTSNLPTQRWQQWSSMGFGKRGWSVEIIGENEECVMDLKQNPNACVEPITIRPQNDLVIVKDNQYYMTLLKGETENIDFNTGIYEFYAFDNGRVPFGTGWNESWFYFDESTPVLLTGHTNSTTDFINLTDGVSYHIDSGSEIMSFKTQPIGYPFFGYIQCSAFNQDYKIACYFK